LSRPSRPEFGDGPADHGDREGAACCEGDALRASVIGIRSAFEIAQALLALTERVRGKLAISVR
jgi:hypothetical protein